MPVQPKQPIRFFKRRRAQIPVLLSVGNMAPAAPHTASIVDLSFLGMRVRAEAQLKPGQTVNVTRMTGAPAIIPGQVVWVGPPGSNEEGQAGLGTVLCPAMSLQSLPALLRDEPALAAVLGRRSAVLAVPEAARPLALAGLARVSGRSPLLVVSHDAANLPPTVLHAVILLLPPGS